MTTTPRPLLSAVILFMLVGHVSAGGGPLPTIARPEDAAVLDQASGHVLVSGAEIGGILAISLPDLSPRQLVSHRGVITVAGPDQTGRIAYTMMYVSPATQAVGHALRAISLDGSVNVTLFDRAGDPLRAHLIGKHLALSPSGGNLAVVGPPLTSYVDRSDKKRRKDDRIGELIEGPLHVWSLETHRATQVAARSLDAGLSWFPGGRRLAYTALLPRNQVVAEDSSADVAAGFDGLQRVPTVMILDLASGKSEFFHPGWRPMVMPDGEAILLSDMRQYKIVSVTTKRARTISLPGAIWPWRGVVGIVRDDVIVYPGIPTAGSPQRWSESYSPLVGPKPLGTLKIANPDTGLFKTIFERLHPRMSASFGHGRRP